MIWALDFQVPESPDAPFPASAVCMNKVALPDVPGTTGGEVWVQMEDQSLTSYTGELFLQQFEWVREGRGLNFDQFARLTMVSPRGALTSLRKVVEIPAPYGAGFYGVGSLGNPATVFGYGPAPILRADPPAWDMEMWTTGYGGVSSLQHYVPGVESGPFFQAMQAGVGTVLRPTPDGGRRTAILPPGNKLASGIGYNLGKVGGAQTFTPRFRQWRSDRVEAAIYWVRTRISGNATNDAGWNITSGSPLPPYALEMKATKLAIVRIASSFNGDGARRDGEYYWQAEQYHDTMSGGFPSTRAVSTLTLGPVNMLGIGEVDLLDYDTWPSKDINITWSYGVDGAGNGSQYDYDASRVISAA